MAPIEDKDRLEEVLTANLRNAQSHDVSDKDIHSAIQHALADAGYEHMRITAMESEGPEPETEEETEE